MAKPIQTRITGTDSVRYLRVSSKGQVETEYNPEGISLPAQRDACQEREHELGSVSVAEFIEPGQSGKNIEDRPAFQDMLAYLETHPGVRYVIVYALSRFARNRYDDAVTMMALKQIGVRLISATEKNLDESPAGRMMHGMLAVFNEYQVEQSGADIKYKMGQKVIKYGGTLGPAKLGYLNETVRFDGHKVNTISVDPERASYVRMAFELYATGTYTLVTLREALTEAGLRTKGNRRYGPRPISLHKLGDLLQDRYYLGYVSYDGVEYQGRHEPLISQELFDRVQRVLFSERRAGARQRIHNHYLKGLLWCDRCHRRLIIMPGKSKSGEVYFYYICRGRQDGSCDLRYLHVKKIERLVEAHYATVQLSETFRGRMLARLDATRASATTMATRLRDQLTQQLTELDLQEDRYLDLVGDPDWPKEKLSAKMRKVREEKARIQERLTQADSPIDSGYEVLTTVLRLLADPLLLYQTASRPTRKVLNKAIFGKLYVNADEQGPFVASDELNEPFETVLYARRESSFSQVLEEQERARLVAGTEEPHTLGDLLVAALGTKCSSKNPMVELRGVEPRTSCMP
jgi:DNA invertase Pin-like site-specific DNA recombinase